MNWAKYNKFLYGFLPGLFLPIVFCWIFLKKNHLLELSFWETLQLIFPSIMLGKLFILSIIPNLVGVFIFYKQDAFKIGIGMMLGGLPYLVVSIFML